MIIYSSRRLEKDIRNLVNKDEFEKDFFYHYLFIVSHVRTFHFLDRRFERDEFIPVNMFSLKKLVSYNYAHKFLNSLVEAEILFCDNYYVKSLKSKGYKLNPKYLADKFNKIECKDKKLEKKIDTKQKEKYNEVFEKSKGYGYVTRCVEDLELSKESYKYIEDNVVELNQNSSYTMMSDIFDYKFATVDDKGNRLHNNLTNFPTELRQFISYKGKKISQVDIKNSQPLFLYLLLKKSYFVPEDEMNKYKDVVCNIGFYEFFAEKMDYKLTTKSRKKFKQRIFGGVLFDKNRKNMSKYETVFKKEFPMIYHVVRKIKEKEYKDVAIMLQKTESEFIFYCVEKIMEEKKIPLFTIHDSICSVVGNESVISKIMWKQFQEIYNIEPQLNIETFG